jgi:hypothetical protein
MSDPESSPRSIRSWLRWFVQGLRGRPENRARGESPTTPREPYFARERETGKPVHVTDLLPTDTVKFSVNLLGEDIRALTWMATHRRTTITDALIRCIATQRWLDEQLDRGATFILSGRLGRRHRVIFR